MSMSVLPDDFVFYFQQGGYVMPPLMLACIVLWFALGYRASALRRGNRRSVRVLISRYRRGYMRRPRGIIDGAVVRAMDIQSIRRDNLRPYLDDAFAPYERELGRYNNLVKTIVAVAPVLGLLGTVDGMIETFESLGNMSLFSQSGGIAGGISQALFTTQMGLAVAIPGLIINGFLERRQRAMNMELAQIKDVICSTSREEAV